MRTNPDNTHRCAQRPTGSFPLAIAVVAMAMVPPAWSRAGAAPPGSSLSQPGQKPSRKTGTKAPRPSKPLKQQPRLHSARPSPRSSSIHLRAVLTARWRSASRTGSVHKWGHIVVVSSTNGSLVGKRLPWNTQQAFSRSSVKVLLADRCVVEISKGTKLAFLESQDPCGQILLLSGHIRVWPLREIDVAGRRGHISLHRPAKVWLGPEGPRSHALDSQPGASEPLPVARVATRLDPDAVLPHPRDSSRGISFGVQEAVSSVGGGSMCLDTSGGSGSAGSVQQGPTTIQKPTPKARVIVKVEVSR